MQIFYVKKMFTRRRHFESLRGGELVSLSFLKIPGKTGI